MPTQRRSRDGNATGAYITIAADLRHEAYNKDDLKSDAREEKRGHQIGFQRLNTKGWISIEKRRPLAVEML